MKILIMGLPGSGKTTLALNLFMKLQQAGENSTWLNADSVRKMFGDQDFSVEGRIRQSQRMAELANYSSAKFVICDFIAPLNKSREIFNADYTVWVNTIKKSKFEDTDALFEPPTSFDLEVTTQDAENWANVVLNSINTKTN